MNLFQVYYQIGKKLPFQVKRVSCDYVYLWDDPDFLYNEKGRTFMVEKIKITNKIYGFAYGYLLWDGVRDDDNEYMNGYEKGTIPCAGLDGWELIKVPGYSIDELFPKKEPDWVFPFGKHKGETLYSVYVNDCDYLNWMCREDRFFRIDKKALEAKELDRFQL